MKNKSQDKNKSKNHSENAKCYFLLFVLFIVAILIAFIDTFWQGVALAEENEDVVASLDNYVDDGINNLDLDEFEQFVSSLDEDTKDVIGFENVKAVLKQFVSGQTQDFFTLFWNALKKDAIKYFVGFLPSVITIVFICILKNTLAGMTSSFLDNSTTEVVHIICYSAVVVIIMVSLVSVVDSVVGTIKSLTKFAEVCFPILITLLASLGSSVGVATYQPMMAVLGGGIMKLISSLIVPAFISCEVFSVVGNLSKNVRLTKINKLFKSSSTWLIGIVFALFGTFLTVGGISGGISDKLGYNVAKFTLSSYVPILGGYLSDGFDLVASSLVLIKSAFGYTAVIVLVGIIVFPLLKLIMFLLSMRLASAIVEPTGDERISNMLSCVADNTTLLITALTGVAFMFFILIMLVIGTCVSL